MWWLCAAARADWPSDEIESASDKPASHSLVGDLDGDGVLDVIAAIAIDWGSPIPWVTLLRGPDFGRFSELAPVYGLEFDVQLADIDGDGAQDLLIADDDLAWVHNLGGGAMAPRAWLLPNLGATRVAAGDLDGDGDPDLLFGNLDGPPTLLRNECRAPGSARILLAGRGKNRDAVGALVRVAAGGRTEVFPVGSSSGFLSTSGRELLVGLGGAPRIDSVDVRWPDGAEERWSDLPAAGLHTLAEGASAGH